MRIAGNLPISIPQRETTSTGPVADPSTTPGRALDSFGGPIAAGNPVLPLYNFPGGVIGPLPPPGSLDLFEATPKTGAPLVAGLFGSTSAPAAQATPAGQTPSTPDQSSPSFLEQIAEKIGDLVHTAGEAFEIADKIPDVVESLEATGTYAAGAIAQGVSKLGGAFTAIGEGIGAALSPDAVVGAAAVGTAVLAIKSTPDSSDSPSSGASTFEGGGGSFSGGGASGSFADVGEGGGGGGGGGSPTADLLDNFD